MSEYSIQFKVDGRVIPEKEILDMELKRYHHVFKQFVNKGISISLNGKRQTLEQLWALDLENAKLALAQTREAIGKEKTLQLFKDEIDQSNEMWHDISDNANNDEPMQKAIVEVKTENISLFQFMMFNQLLMKTNNLYMPSMIHPEHYYFDANSKGEQRIIETFGMYQQPSFLDLKPASNKVYPIKPDSDSDLIMAGNTYLAQNGLDTKIIGMHQLKNKKNGMIVKLGVFLPKSAPSEILEGHKWHLMVEFNNGLHIAAQQHPNFFKKFLMNLALKKLKNK